MAEKQEQTPATSPRPANKKRPRDEAEDSPSKNASNGSIEPSKKKARREKHKKGGEGDRKKRFGKDKFDKKKRFGKKFDKKKRDKTINGQGKGEPGRNAAAQEERKPPQDDVNEAIGKMDARLIADHLLQKAKRHNKDLTAVELSDMMVSQQAFLDTTAFESPRTLDQLPAFLKAHSRDNGSHLSKAPEGNGTPHTLVVAAAALRAADLVRALRQFQTKDAVVAKLFAKHIKLDEAKEFLGRTRVNIGVGTPQRISDLLDSGSLKIDALERIVIDGSHIDQKKRGIFDMKETFFPLLQLLNRPEFRDRYGRPEGQGLHVLVY
ncbi:hypothetical protein VTN31DRAFT_7505 [Thermomyces dupontii]|uniref:uncharacterized protein n=1 Tax=Talaromyces thermophilus TaxID=28565 RepID=UPI0037448200